MKDRVMQKGLNFGMYIIRLKNVNGSNNLDLNGFLREIETLNTSMPWLRKGNM